MCVCKVTAKVYGVFIFYTWNSFFECLRKFRAMSKNRILIQFMVIYACIWNFPNTGDVIRPTTENPVRFDFIYSSPSLGLWAINIPGTLYRKRQRQHAGHQAHILCRSRVYYRFSLYPRRIIYKHFVLIVLFPENVWVHLSKIFYDSFFYTSY
jgi:hypothetical protein